VGGKTLRFLGDLADEVFLKAVRISFPRGDAVGLGGKKKERAREKLLTTKKRDLEGVFGRRLAHQKGKEGISRVRGGGISVVIM